MILKIYLISCVGNKHTKAVSQMSKVNIFFYKHEAQCEGENVTDRVVKISTNQNLRIREFHQVK